MKYLSIIFALFFAFSAFGQTPDIDAPFLGNLDFNPKVINLSDPSQVFVLTIQVTDNKSGFKEGIVGFERISGFAGREFFFTSNNRVSGDALNGVYEVRVPANTFFKDSYYVYQIRLDDQFGNRRRYFPYRSEYPLLEVIDAPSAQCTYSLSPPSINITANGGGGSFTVTTQSDCAFSSTTGNDFISIDSGATGTGTQNVSFFVQANTTGAMRTGTITVGGQTFTINQAAGKSRKRLRFITQ